jgi:hypothetical protein
MPAGYCAWIGGSARSASKIQNDDRGALRHWVLLHCWDQRAAEGALPFHLSITRGDVLLDQQRSAASCSSSTEQNAQYISRHAGRLVLATSYSRTTYRRTTIGAAAFHCRVRNGNGWCHCAMITRVRNRTGGFAAFAATQARGRVSGDCHHW